MLHRFSVVLAGAAVALTGLVAGEVGSAEASPTTLSTTASPSPTPTPRPTLTCPPVLPVTGGVSAVDATSATISYAIYLSPPCGYNPPVTVTLFASREDAQQWRNPVAEAVSGPERSGTVTVDGLTPDTAYWFRFSLDGRPDPYVLGSVRTAAQPVCAATAVIDHGWSGGFVATVTVRNVGNEALDGWRVAWRWSGDQRIQAAWNATVEGSGADVTVRNASHNGTLAPSASTTFGMLVSGSVPPGGIAPTCAR
ncbi:cellulose binding domain-containing protein [Actinomycetes bacterium KLBMP 9797]